MLHIETILCPTDLSDASVQSVPLATHFARLHGADLHLLHVHLLHAMSPDEDEDVPFPGEEEARAALEASAGGISWNQVVHRIERGINAAPTIIDYADANDVDLIVMGSHGRRGLRRLMLGSVTTEVVRFARRPVLVVRHEEDAAAPTEVDRLIVPVDFSRASHEAVAVALELASTLDVPIELLHAVEPIPYVQMAYPISVDTGDFKDYAQHRLDEIVEQLDTSREIRTTVSVDMAEQAVIDAAYRSSSPLVVMASHGHSGLSRVLLGSTTERLLRKAPCPVLVAPTDAEEEG
ncbi:MAG TPA: universal stress protein [Gemmatimonadota bacterium]|nr:universal stress protein [Gemmatimonadota bacterium]